MDFRADIVQLDKRADGTATEVHGMDGLVLQQLVDHKGEDGRLLPVWSASLAMLGMSGRVLWSVSDVSSVGLRWSLH